MENPLGAESSRQSNLGTDGGRIAAATRKEMALAQQSRTSSVAVARNGRAREWLSSVTKCGDVRPGADLAKERTIRALHAMSLDEVAVRAKAEGVESERERLRNLDLPALVKVVTQEWPAIAEKDFATVPEKPLAEKGCSWVLSGHGTLQSTKRRIGYSGFFVLTWVHLKYYPSEDFAIEYPHDAQGEILIIEMDKLVAEATEEDANGATLKIRMIDDDEEDPSYALKLAPKKHKGIVLSQRHAVDQWKRQLEDLYYYGIARNSIITQLLVSNERERESLHGLEFGEKGRDGPMNRKAITELLAQKQLDCSPATIEHLFACYDTDRSGTIDQNEFANWTAAMITEKTALIEQYMARESRWSSKNITPSRPSWRKIFLFYYNGIFHNNRNKTVYVRYKAELEALQRRVNWMYEQMALVTSKVTDKAGIGDGDSDVDHIALQTNEYSRDDDVIFRKTGDEARKLDELVREVDPLFMARFLEAMSVSYLELDNLMLEKAEHKLVDPEPAWRAGSEERPEGRDGTGQWGFTIPSRLDAFLDGIFGLVRENDINDMFFIAGAPIRRFSSLHQ